MKKSLLFLLLTFGTTTLEAATLDYSTFLGGSSGDYGKSVAVDVSGNCYVTGETYSSNFPTTVGAFDTSQNGSFDVFVTKLNSDGSSLLFSTFLGGNNADYGKSIAVDGSGNCYVTGETYSSNFPTTVGAFDTSQNGIYDAFVTKLSSGGSSLEFSTFLGGSSYDYGTSLSLDVSGNCYFTGYTQSSNFPTTTGAYDTSLGYNDAFVTKLNSSGSSLEFSTFLGGSNNYEESRSLSLDGSGNAYVMGNTRSTDFPTTSGAYDTSLNGPLDAFVTKLNSSGSSLVFSTFLGGSSNDFENSLSVDGSGNCFVTGYTQSTDFPTTSGAYDTSFNGGYYDAFVTKLNSSGSSLVFSTFLGGSSNDYGNSLSVDGSGNCYVTGETSPSSFPTTIDAYDTSYNGGYSDVFVTKLNSSGSALEFSTFLGGGSEEIGRSVSVDGSGNCYVTGETQSSSFPTTVGAFDTSFNGSNDVFVSKFLFAAPIIPPSFTTGDPALPGTAANNGNGGTDFTSGIETLGSIGTQGGTTAMSLLNVNGTNYISYYDLDCNGQTGVEVCFNVNSDWLTGFNGDPSTELRIGHNGSFLSGNTITSLGNGNYRVCGTAPSCSPFFVQDQDDTPLAITISHFSLKSTENSIQLNWTTESETNNLGFKVMRSVDGLANFNVVASYENNPNLKGQGNSATPTSYTWNDTEVEPGKTYFYYLADVDFNLFETHNTDRTLSGKLTTDTENNETRFVYELKQNFPNPFNPSTTISYSLARTNDVKLEVFNTKGELIRTLVSEKQNEGFHDSFWNGTDTNGNVVSSGVYFCKLTAGNYTQTNKMILLK